METVKAKTEIRMNLGKDPLFGVCPLCGREVKHLWQPGRYEDDSNPVRMCQSCDTAWIWPYPG